MFIFNIFSNEFSLPGAPAAAEKKDEKKKEEKKEESEASDDDMGFGLFD